MDLISQNEHKTRFKFQSNSICPQKEYFPWDVVFDITKPKFLMASQIREMLFLYILLQDFQPNLLGYRKTMISWVAFDSACEFRGMYFWFRKCDGHRIRKKVVSHLRHGIAISGLTPSHGKSWTDWFNIWGQMNLGIRYNAVKQLTDFALLCSETFLYSLPRGHWLPLQSFICHIIIQGNATSSSWWEYHTYYTPAPSGWSSLWVLDWHSVAHWASLRGGENSKSSASSSFFTGPGSKYL